MAIAKPGYKRDIEELIDDYSKMESIEFRNFKLLWMNRSFSSIFDAKPIDLNDHMYMQILYSCCLSKMKDANSFFLKLSCLYCIYSLYETQTYTPKTLIYLAISDVQSFRSILSQVKSSRAADAFHVIKTLSAKDCFLFGAVENPTVEATRQIDSAVARHRLAVRIARSKLLESFPIEKHITEDLSEEFNLVSVVDQLNDYNKFKKETLGYECDEIISQVVNNSNQSQNQTRNQVQVQEDSSLIDFVKSWEAKRAETLEASHHCGTKNKPNE